MYILGGFLKWGIPKMDFNSQIHQWLGFWRNSMDWMGSTWPRLRLRPWFGNSWCRPGAPGSTWSGARPWWHHLGMFLFPMFNPPWLLLVKSYRTGKNCGYTKVVNTCYNTNQYYIIINNYIYIYMVPPQNLLFYYFYWYLRCFVHTWGGIIFLRFFK